MKQLISFSVSVVLGAALVAQADTFPVVNANDSGPGSLRAAIDNANNLPGPDIIRFQIPGPGVRTITLLSPLPWVVDEVLIDGYTQPGASPNSLAVGNNAALRIEINGANAGPGADGLFLVAPDCTVRGLILNRFSGSGVRVMMVFNCVIAGNFIGTDPTGTQDRGNAQHGVWLERTINCRVGGPARADRNVISGNDGCGVEIDGFDGIGNVVQGNLIGTTAAGTMALPNRDGVCVYDTPGHLIGGTALGAGNVISGNATNGVFLRGALSTGNTVQGNFVGTAPGGLFAIPNGTGVRIEDAIGVAIGGTAAAARNVISGNRGVGVFVTGATSSSNRVEGNWIGTDASGNLPLGNGGDGIAISSARKNSIGGNVPGAGNVISANGGAGIYLFGSTATNNRVERNDIGTASDGASPLGNTGVGVLLSLGAHHNFIGGYPVAQMSNIIAFNAVGVALTPTAGVGNSILGNSIFSNLGLGIDLGTNGVTLNDLADPDSGPNRFQNFPVILLGYTIDNHTVVIASLNSVPSNTFRIEFFASPEPDPSGYGEGQLFLGSCMAATDATGNSTFTFFAERPAPPDWILTATATDTDGSTSEFSSGAPAAIPPVIVDNPVTQCVLLHSSVSFSVTAEGTEPLTYQWYFNGSPLLNETNATLFIADAVPSAEGAYHVVVENQMGVATSAPALLTVQQPIVIVMQPAGVVVDAGGFAELCVTAEGSGTIQYQWRLNGLNIPDQTNRCIQLPEFALRNAGTYSVIAANPVSLLQSEFTPVRLNGVPVVDGGNQFAERVPLSRSVGMLTSSNTFATVEDGEPDHAGKPGGHSLWYCWLAPSNGVATFTTVGSGFDTLLSIYTGTNLTSLVSGTGDDDRSGFLTSIVRFNALAGEKYQIAVDGFAGETGGFVLSWELDTTQPPLPVILSQPSSVTVREGQPAGFGVSASGGPLGYQWFFNGQALESETTSSLFISNVTPAHVGGYSVRVFGTEGAGSVESQVAQLEIGPVSYIQSIDKLPELVFARAPGGIKLANAAAKGGSSLVGGFVPVTQGTPDSQVMNNQAAGHSIFEDDHCGVVGGASRWFGLVPATTGVLVLDTFGSTFDTVLAVYTGPTNYNSADPTEFWGRLRLVACNDNVPGTNVSQVCFTPRPTTNYFIAIDGRDGARGTVRLNWRLIPPPPLLPGSNNKQLVRLGSDATLRAYTSNVPANVSYQWTWFGTNLPSATNNALFLCNLQLAHAGEYKAIVITNTMTLQRSRVRLVVAQLLQRLSFNDGALRFQVNGLASERVALDLATNIFQWTPMTTNTAPASTNTSAQAQRERYFRLRPLP